MNKYIYNCLPGRDMNIQVFCQLLLMQNRLGEARSCEAGEGF